MFWVGLVAIEQRIEWVMIFGTYGPAAIALILVAREAGLRRIAKLLRRYLIWRVNILWYLFSLIGTAAAAWAALTLHRQLGGEIIYQNDPEHWYLIIPGFIYIFIFSVLGEEIGWRGYVLPRLQARFSALTASVILGVIWSLWHLPLLWMSGSAHQTIPLPLYILQSVAFSIILTWVYNGTGGSLLLVHLLHTASNLTVGVLPILPIDTGGDTRTLGLLVGIIWIVALMIVTVFGAKDLSTKMRVTSI